MTRDIAHSTRGRILSGLRFTFFGYLTSGILSGQTWPDPLIGYFTFGTWCRMREEGVSTSPVRHDQILWSDISHPAPDAEWEMRAFQLPRSDMSGSSDSAYPESIRSRQFRFLGQLGSSDTRDSSDPFPPTIKKQTLILLTTKSPFCTVQRNFSWSFLIFPTDFFEIFCFRYLMSKSSNSPCNQPIIGFLSL